MSETSSHLERARAVFDIEIAALQQTRNRLDGGFTAAVTLLQATLANGGKIIVTGVGKSFHIGQKIAATFTSTGAPANVLHPSEAMHGDLGLLQPADVVLALSYSGESDELVNLLPIIKRTGVRIIALTGVLDATLARHSDVVLDGSVTSEACPFNLVPTASTTVALAIGDALAIALLEARGMTREKYAQFHPGGAIGRALLLKVDDIMRTGARLAAVPHTASVRDAVIAMTKAQAGAVAVVDENRHVVGLFTDGDLRRYLAGGATDVQSPVANLMTHRPSTVNAGRLAADALAIFQQHHFDDLVVVHDDGTLAGMIDIQDLPKFKIL
ncbi:MAG TPA: KpsF/GutQ family sugar-phosphate isomerase [Kiritimatiellia bacterium]|jgi:arabinose-5-phosphate isomerase|nr:KpsF/GutQ family sugar-phosphate isomerase [Kiritimatiellia bacterium]OQC58611.1 MAG: Arabinose 5-phosphate isomerase KdsD [Verrucomicrobia bacterium ADurb.Bin018]MBP9572161.1 KpsF/GutQ family sugar-phosphate isomerase [Kiritimatiellia bacterium]HOD99950.1 KpsF/GutQ family sugar-phosphate isomerase [Kiritimatiellia bacterium]HOE36554.1 KpsF/GutQ family sugar-phosphate isomerase [Kiritimatiellia bacterium]